MLRKLKKKNKKNSRYQYLGKCEMTSLILREISSSKYSMCKICSKKSVWEAKKCLEAFLFFTVPSLDYHYHILVK